MKMTERIVAAGLMLVMSAVGARLALADETPPPPPFWVMYDLNHDGEVDGADIGKFAEHWIAYQASATYNAEADFNGDKRIDYLDAMRIIEAVIRATASGQSVRSQAHAGEGGTKEWPAPVRSALAKALVEEMVRGAGRAEGRAAGR